ncbi:hypothetical protein SMICM304S_02882 [Streptomyces microflavus]
MLENLINVGSVDRGFRAVYGTFETDGVYVRRDYDFKLIEEVPGYGGTVYLRATDEAVNVLVGALDTDVTSAQIAAEVKLEVLISRGHLADAQLAAEQARYRTVQYAETLRRTLEATRRNVRAVDWLTTVPDMIAEALDHVADRYRHENAILTNIRKARDEAEDPEHKRRAAELVDIVKDAIHRHTQLQSRLLEAGPLLPRRAGPAGVRHPRRPRGPRSVRAAPRPAPPARRRTVPPGHRRVLRPRHRTAHPHLRPRRRPRRPAPHPAAGAGAPRHGDARARPDRDAGRQPVQRHPALQCHGPSRPGARRPAQALRAARRPPPRAATGRRAPSPGSPTPSPPGSASSSWRSPRAPEWPSPRARTPSSPSAWALRPPRLLRRRRPLPPRPGPPRRHRPRLPRPEDLADDAYIGRITVNGVDAFVRQACRRLEERAEEPGDNTDPASDTPGLESGWRIYARRSSTGATKDARRIAGSTTGIIGKAVAFLTDSGFLQRTGDNAGGAYRTTARYQLQVRDMAGSAAMAELLELGVVPVTDGSATLLPPSDPDDLELAADAGLPFHS